MIVGIDVSKDKLDVHILSSSKHFTIKNTKASIASFMKNKLLPQGRPELTVFESTGGYEKVLQVYLLREGLPYHKAHPNRVHHFAKSKGYFAKTDRIDAKMLSQYGQQKEIVANRQDSEEQIISRELSSRKAQLKTQIESERHRLNHDFLSIVIKRSIKRLLTQLKKELAVIEKAISKKITENNALSEKHYLLKTIKGVGNEVATMMVTDLPELGHLSREEISSLVGVAPQTKDSGKKQGHRAIGRGRFYVGKALYMAALVAIMRKMLIMMNAMVKNGTPWQESRI